MTTTDFAVTGLTCGHCVAAVTEELTALDGVTAVTVDLHPEAVSTVSVTADPAVSDDQVAAALEEAGDYVLTGRS